MHEQPSKSYADSLSLSAPDGIDLLVGAACIQAHYPFLDRRAVVAIHARRCGWLDAQGLGHATLDGASDATTSVSLLRGTVDELLVADGAVHGVSVRLRSGSNEAERQPARRRLLRAPIVVNASGPFAAATHALSRSSIALPLRNHLHAKAVFHDTLGIVPQARCPMVIAANAITLPWTDEERSLLSGEHESWIAKRWLDTNLPSGILEALLLTDCQSLDADSSVATLLNAGAHFRPAGNGWLLMLWDWAHEHASEPALHDLQQQLLQPDDEPLISSKQYDELYPELLVRGLATLVPELSRYIGAIGRSTYVDGGYYTKTPDSLPLVGAIPDVRGLYVIGGFAGFGIMAAHGAAELLAHSILGKALPHSLPDPAVFDPARFGSGNSAGSQARQPRPVVGGQL